MEVSGQLHAPTALLPGEEPPVPVGARASRLARSLINIMTVLPRLHD
jgi:hypothetical protein